MSLLLSLPILHAAITVGFTFAILASILKVDDALIIGQLGAASL